MNDLYKRLNITLLLIKTKLFGWNRSQNCLGGTDHNTGKSCSSEIQVLIWYKKNYQIEAPKTIHLVCFLEVLDYGYSIF